MSELTPKVTGIGGIFFKSKNPSIISQWYGDNLGLAMDPPLSFAMRTSQTKSTTCDGALLRREAITLIRLARNI